MSNMKKTIKCCIKTAICAVLLMICAIGVNVSASAPEYQQDQAQELLRVLGVLDSEYKPEEHDEITRAEFTQMAVSLMNLGELDADMNIPFVDVAINDESYSSICIAYACGFISGNGDNTFRPNDAITTAEAAKIVTSMVGYTPVAEDKGGFLPGYISVAQRIGVFDGVDLSDETVDGEKAVRMLYNTLFVDVYKQITFGGETNRYILNEGESVLKNAFDIEWGDGILNATEYTSLIGTGTENGNEILIDDIRYICSNAEADGLLGMHVLYFYKLEGTVRNLVYVCSYNHYNDIIEISDDIIENVEKGEISYRNERGKVVQEKIDNLVDVIYNGMVYTSWKTDDLFVKNGKLVLIDNDADGDTDVIFVYEYQDYVVREYGEPSKKINLMFNSGSIDLEEDNVITSIFFEGKEISASALQKWDVLSVLESHEVGGKILRVIEVARKAFSGTIYAVKDDVISVNGVEYRYIAREDYLEISAGLTGKFVCNILDKIVACDVGDEYSYAYLRDKNISTGFTQVIKVRLLTAANPKAEYILADNVKVDGLSNLDKSEIYRRLEVDELIRIRINSSNEISYIDTLEEGANDENDTLAVFNDNGAVSQSLRYRSAAYTLFYRQSSDTYIPKAIVTTGTMMFFVPDDGNDDLYSTGSITKLINDFSYTVKIYDMSDTNVASAVIVKADESIASADETSSVSIVTGVSTSINSDGDTVISLEMSRGGITIEDFWIDSGDNDVYKDLSAGDIIQYAESNTDIARITSVRILLDAKNPGEYFHNTLSSTGTRLVTSWGEVTKIDSNSCKLKVDSVTGEEHPYYLKAGLVFYIYDTEYNTVKLGSISDLAIGDKVFFRESSYAVQEGIIVR